MRERCMERFELETIIVFNPVDDNAHVFTYSRGWRNHFKKLGVKPTEVNNAGGMTFEIPKSWVHKPYPPRIMSDAQRQALRNAHNSGRTAVGRRTEREKVLP